MNKKRMRHQLVVLSALLVCGLIPMSCMDDLAENKPTATPADANIVFNIVEQGEQDTTSSTRAMTQYVGIQPNDLVVQKLACEGDSTASSDLCLIESTVASVNATQPVVETRANIITRATLGRFSSIGYRGVTRDAISTTPWFYNKSTNADGSLVTPIRWEIAQPFAKFFAIYPETNTTDIVLSPETHQSVPYVDFEVNADVKKQKDLMTAYSGVVHYATQFVAPRTDLAFRHALTAVRFKVGQNLSWNKTITKVEIIGAKSRGRYTLSASTDGSGAAWSDLSTPKTCVLNGISVNTAKAANQILLGEDGDNYTFYMLPQSLAGISVKVYFSDNSSITANLKGSWLAGTTKTYSLSESNSTWDYQLAVTSPATVDYTATTTAAYTIQSYRQVGTRQEPVAWQVVGYQESADGGSTFGAETTTKPAWLTGLGVESGSGGIVATSATATLSTDIKDLLAEYNQVLQTATAKGSSSSYYNLSNSTGEATVQNTANCYVISAPGYYRIPLVYGNAIKGGTMNTNAYKSTATAESALKVFKDHNGKDITEPYINTQNSSNKATQVSIVWADQGGMVTNLAVSNDFVQFQVPASTIKNGNAVIAVKNSSGVVMWSWHLWFTQESSLSRVRITTGDNKAYGINKLPLGFVYRKWEKTRYEQQRVVRVKVAQTIGNAGVKYAYIDIRQNAGKAQEHHVTLYQFGRKDAFPGVTTLAEGSVSNRTEAISFSKWTQNPSVFYCSDNSWRVAPPTGFAYSNLWSANNTSADINNALVVKTVYDPSPYGWKLPPSNLTTAFTMARRQGTWEYGANFTTGDDNTIYIPTTGMKDNKTGSLSYTNAAYYHTAIPKSGDCYAFVLYESSYDPVPRSRVYGRGILLKED